MQSMKKNNACLQKATAKIYQAMNQSIKPIQCWQTEKFNWQ